MPSIGDLTAVEVCFNRPLDLIRSCKFNGSGFSGSKLPKTPFSRKYSHSYPNCRTEESSVAGQSERKLFRSKVTKGSSPLRSGLVANMFSIVPI